MKRCEDGAAARLEITVQGPVSLSLLKVRPTPCFFVFGFCSSNFQENLWHIFIFSYPTPESLDCPFSPSLETMTSAKTQRGGKVGYCLGLCGCF